ncbi:class I SAM-dependent methyltransferase [Meiothermus sp. CFH 77666]|uniref:class I SAM-dependent methyltransferase n=1 Tax=Meiothermus sp. CFH 77666 TaxID=2817942 RepID=UPI001AA075CC|nr:class I SAM-dependent methyltransferase [Meiothermus sp. CFH 77666]MBO1438732.1 class I SAM-dependent methyltransferase [Meiothermus sp. CFH 77666]
MLKTPHRWDYPSTIRYFEQKPPDHRMVARLGSLTQARVLDLGCAAGRNTVWLAERGLEVYALDSAEAMVAHTREHLRPYLAQPEQRVLLGRMDSLKPFPCCFFDFVLAFGVLHFAQSLAEWEAAVREITRVLRPGGELLLSHHSPRSNLDGVPLEGTSEPHVYRRASGRQMVLLEAHVLDQRLAEWGFAPVAPTDETITPTERGWRVTVRGHYRLEVNP